MSILYVFSSFNVTLHISPCPWLALPVPDLPCLPGLVSPRGADPPVPSGALRCILLVPATRRYPAGPDIAHNPPRKYKNTDL